MISPPLYQMVYVMLEIVGEDVFLEQLFSSNGAEDLEIGYRLGSLAKCRLCLAV